jgi:hypothetical protein
VLFGLQETFLLLIEDVDFLLHVEGRESCDLNGGQLGLIVGDHASFFLGASEVGSLLELIGFESDNWVVSSFIFNILLLSLFISGLVWVGSVVLGTVLAFKTLLHSDNCLLGEGLGGVLMGELLTLLSAEVIGDKVLSNLHGMKLSEFLINTLLLGLSVDFLLS